MTISRRFGTLPNGEAVTAYDLISEVGFKATILSYGATLQSLVFPDGTDVVLGFDGLAGYLGDHPYIGAIIGRNANRIGGASFEIDGVNYNLPKNEGSHNLHSGPLGFDRVNWAGEIKGKTLILRHTSPDGHQDFPGVLETELRFIFEGNTLSLEMRASTDKASLVNLTYHPYFNLTDGGASSCEDHRLEIIANSFTPLDRTMIPTGDIMALDDTPLDYRKDRMILVNIPLDHNFVRADKGQTSEMKKLAKLSSVQSGHKVIICSTQPCFQVYTGEYIASIPGKLGNIYGPFHGITIEPQGFIDSLNHPAFPDQVLYPGEIYHHKISYTFRSAKDQA